MLFNYIACVLGMSICDAVFEGQSAETLKVILDNGLLLPDKDGSLLVAALKKGASLEILEYIIYRGASVNAVDNQGVSPLIKAVSLMNIEAIKLFLRCGAQINHQSRYSQFILYF